MNIREGIMEFLVFEESTSVDYPFAILPNEVTPEMIKQMEYEVENSCDWTEIYFAAAEKVLGKS